MTKFVLGAAILIIAAFIGGVFTGAIACADAAYEVDEEE